LDVTGIHSKDELGKVWGMVHLMQPISYDVGRYILPNPNDPENVHARKVAKALITHYLNESTSDSEVVRG